MAKAPDWTREQIAHLKKLYGNTDISEMAIILGRSAGAIRSKASEIGISKREGRWGKEDLAYLEKNYLRLGAKQVAVTLGRTVSSIHSKARLLKCGKPSIGPKVEWDEKSLQYLRDHYQEQTYEEIGKIIGRTSQAVQVRGSMLGLRRYVDPFPFFETWSEESAYIVGLFAADGWVSKRGPKSIRIGIELKDIDILLRISEIVGGSGNVVRKGSGMYLYYFHSTKAYEWLCDIFGHDVCKKSHTLRWPSIPGEYVKHFLRGAYDGDGSLMRKEKKSWEASYTTSSNQFIRGLVENVCLLTGITLSVGENKTNVYHARTTGIKAVCLADLLYRDCNIALERKAWIAREMMEASGVAYRSSITPKMREMFPHIIERYKII